jgi:hypothetical protein
MIKGLRQTLKRDGRGVCDKKYDYPQLHPLVYALHREHNHILIYIHIYFITYYAL